ncbi:MAG TPA: siderophore-interacting protein [Acidimicrobiales bacterium]
MTDPTALEAAQPSGRRARPAPLDVEVVRVEPQGGGFVRVVLGGDALEAFVWPGAGSHLKFFPSVSVDSSPVTRAGESAPRPPSRTYTPRSFDAARGELSIDFLLHGDGLCSKWAATAEPGDHVRVSMPRAVFHTSPGATWQLLAGDDSAVPAISTIIEAGVTIPTDIVIETLSQERDRPVLPDHPFISIEWVAAQPARPGAALEEDLAHRAMPDGFGSVWIAGEAVAVRGMRKTLLEKHSVAPDALVTRGYWREGAVNHPDHDFGTDDLDT